MSSSEAACSSDDLSEFGSKETLRNFSETLTITVDSEQPQEKDEILAQTLDNASNESILNPLNLPEPIKLRKIVEQGSSNAKVLCEVSEGAFESNKTPCLLCDQLYDDITEKSTKSEYLCHLIVEHKLVIADVNLITDLRKYAIYWKKRFGEAPIETFCAVIKTNSAQKDNHPSEMYYLLCDEIPEDRILREELQMIRLKELIDIQTTERADTHFEKMCLFCTKFFIGNRNQLFIHMNEDHKFNVGHPHNLVFIDDFLKQIEQKLADFECLYCDKVFKDRVSLIEHMRKKSHRRLNPKDKSYDKYYIINYLELGKNWEVLQNEPDHLEGSDDWSGWDDEIGQTAVCFFCVSQFGAHDTLFDHMKENHDFDFVSLKKDMSLSFYQQVKMVNYIRRTVIQLKKSDEASVIETDGESPTVSDCNKYASAIKRCISSSTKWNQPQYYFPTYENDTLLCQLDDKEGLIEPEDNFIIGEDGIDCKAIINGSILTDLVVHGYFD